MVRIIDLIKEEFSSLYFSQERYVGDGNYKCYLYINEDYLPIILDESIGKGFPTKPNNATSYKEVKKIYFPIVGYVEIIIDNKVDNYKIEIRDA